MSLQSHDIGAIFYLRKKLPRFFNFPFQHHSHYLKIFTKQNVLYALVSSLYLAVIRIRSQNYCDPDMNFFGDVTVTVAPFDLNLQC